MINRTEHLENASIEKRQVILVNGVGGEFIKIIGNFYFLKETILVV